MRLLVVEVPYPKKLVIPEFPLLIPSVQQLPKYIHVTEDSLTDQNKKLCQDKFTE